MTIDDNDEVECGRCHKKILVKNAECCWWCTGWLCYECWDEYGHCGHSEADKINEDAKKVKQPE